MTLNMTGIVEANTLWDIMVGVDNAASGQLGGFHPIAFLTVMSVFVIIFIRGAATNPYPQALFSASLVCIVLSYIFLYFQMLNLAVLVVFFVIMVASAIGMYKSKST